LFLERLPVDLEPVSAPEGVDRGAARRPAALSGKRSSSGGARRQRDSERRA
jgi:hypothetical protein